MMERVKRETELACFLRNALVGPPHWELNASAGQLIMEGG
jgi:hypothetical protein